MINVHEKYGRFLKEMGDDIGRNFKEATELYDTAEQVVCDRKNILNNAKETFQFAFNEAVKLIQQMFFASVFKKKRGQLLASGFGNIINTLKESDDNAKVMAEAEKNHYYAARAAENALRERNAAAKETKKFDEFMQK